MPVAIAAGSPVGYGGGFQAGGPGRRLLDHTEHEGLEIAYGQILARACMEATDG
jgi:hypothetical protein